MDVCNVLIIQQYPFYFRDNLKKPRNLCSVSRAPEVGAPRGQWQQTDSSQVHPLRCSACREKEGADRLKAPWLSLPPQTSCNMSVRKLLRWRVFQNIHTLSASHQWRCARKLFRCAAHNNETGYCCVWQKKRHCTWRSWYLGLKQV